MGMNLDNGYEELLRHVGHKVVVVTYGRGEKPWNVALECETCGEVLLDFDEDGAEESSSRGRRS